MHIHSWQFHRQGGAANSTKSLLSLHAPNPLKEKIGVSFLAQPAFLSFPDSRHPPDKLLAGVDPVAQCASLGTVSRCTVLRGGQARQIEYLLVPKQFWLGQTRFGGRTMDQGPPAKCRFHFSNTKARKTKLLNKSSNYGLFDGSFFGFSCWIIPPVRRADGQIRRPQKT